MKTSIGIALCILLATAFSYTRGEVPGAESPRNGKYTIYAYGAAHNPPIYLGYFILTDGSYKAYLPGDKVHGEGKFSYNKGTHEVSWDSGPYAGVYGGTFTLESGGKRHQLRLKSSTVAGNDG
ncbi:MAG: hypothetical protein M3N12_03695 [Verrucomicrobiota bacterium]|nr:hypothetical protein [Verrucomicrobiota bacterium]